MADKIFEDLRKSIAKNSGLVNDVTLKLSDEELTVLTRKSSELGMSNEELLRVYVLGTSAFDASPFEVKKAKTRNSKKQIKDELENK